MAAFMGRVVVMGVVDGVEKRDGREGARAIGIILALSADE
jgi:hypothetical protein